MLTALPVLAALSGAASLPETTLAGGLGASAGDSVAGPTFSVMATHRLSLLELGVHSEATALFSRMLSAGALAGLHVGDTWSLRLLGAAGVRWYHGVGAGLLSDDPGVSGSVPYAGGRLVLGYSFAARASSPHRVFIGLVGALEEDLTRETKSVSYTATPWLFGGEPHRTSSTHTLGQTTWSGLLVAGVDVDLLPY